MARDGHSRSQVYYIGTDRICLLFLRLQSFNIDFNFLNCELFWLKIVLKYLNLVFFLDNLNRTILRTSYGFI